MMADRVASSNGSLASTSPQKSTRADGSLEAKPVVNNIGRQDPRQSATERD